MEEFKMNCKITSISPIQEGVSKAGKEWKKLDVVVDNGKEWGNIVCFEVFGAEKVDNVIKYNKIGQDVEISFNVESREYNGKYYSKISAWKIFSGKKEDVKPTKKATSTTAKDDDLPF